MPEEARQSSSIPKCFISYSWDSDDHKNWVRHLARDLQNNGALTFLDQWDIQPGMDLARYMESCVRENDFVLLICTPYFAQKANQGVGGTGYEKSIVTGEIFHGSALTKFVPVLREGTAQESLPSYLKSRVYLDFRSDKTYVQSAIDKFLQHELIQSFR